MFLRHLIPAIGAALFISLPSTAQDLSNRGTDFWLGYGHNILFTANNPSNTQNQVLYLSSENAATVTVSIPGNGWTQTVNIPANSVDVSIVLPKTGAYDARLLGEGKWNRGIHIQSNQPIEAYTHQYGAQSSGATLLLPTPTLGFTYYSVNYRQSSNIPNAHSWFYVVATENDTRIEITPADTTQGGMLPGQTYTINLDAGEVYNVFGKLENDPRLGKDLTGSKVESISGPDGRCHPIALFSGSSRVLLCTGDGGEFIQQQIFPSSVWGTRYLTHHIIANTNSDLSDPLTNFFRICVSDPTAVVRRNGNIMTGLIANFYYEFDSNGGDLIESDKPIMVCQYTPSSNQCTGTALPPLGDPEMIILSPMEQGIREARFYHSRQQLIGINYVQLIVPTVALNSLRINGNSATSGAITHPRDPSFSVVIFELPATAAQNTVYCDAPFTGIVYGLGAYESYAYNLGTLLNNLNGLPSFSNRFKNLQLPDSFTCVNAPFNFSIQLSSKPSVLRFYLSGLPLNNAVDTTLINPIPSDSGTIFGRKYYHFRLNRDYWFTDSGLFKVKILANLPEIDLCDNTEELFLEIRVKPPPVADFSINYSGCLTDTAFFTQNSNPNGLTLDRYLWRINNGPPVAGQNFRTRLQAGNNRINLRVMSNNGCLHDTTRIITPAIQPFAGFNLASQVICAGDSVLVTDQSSLQGPGNLIRWYFTSGLPAPFIRNNSAPFYLTLPDSGTFRIKLVIETDNQCYSDTFSSVIRVLGYPRIDAGPDIVILEGWSTILQANSEAPPGTVYKWSPPNYLNNPDILNPIATPLDDIEYILTATNLFCPERDSVKVMVLPGVKIPNAFSPNGDGINDVWQITGLHLLPNAKLRLFDRYGKTILESVGYKTPWDGRRNGVLLPAGTYYYILDLGDGSKKITGSVVLIR